MRFQRFEWKTNMYEPQENILYYYYMTIDTKLVHRKYFLYINNDLKYSIYQGWAIINNI